MNLNHRALAGRVLLGALTLLSLTAAALAHPFRVEDMQNLARVGRVRISPDRAVGGVHGYAQRVSPRPLVTNLWRVPTAGASPAAHFVEHGSTRHAPLVRPTAAICTSHSRVDVSRKSSAWRRRWRGQAD